MRADEGVSLLGLTASVCIAYFGIAAGVNGHTAIAVACTAASCLFIAWLERRYARSERQFRGGVVAVLFAIVIAFLGSNYSKDPERSSKLDQLQSGVILSTERKRPVPLILPRPDSLWARPKRPPSRVASILFTGEYWFFRWPLLRPPAGSLIEQGDPTSVDVTSEDFRPMVMQARQSVGKSIDMRCCRSIDVVVRGDDREPRTVVIELILINSSEAQNDSQTLGAETLASVPSDGKRANFRFPMPRHAAIRSFDGLVVWFHLEAPRSRRSATVSIERFDLIP
jgi:hypothetical protein